MSLPQPPSVRSPLRQPPRRRDERGRGARVLPYVWTKLAVDAALARSTANNQTGHLPQAIKCDASNARTRLIVQHQPPRRRHERGRE